MQKGKAARKLEDAFLDLIMVSISKISKKDIPRSHLIRLNRHCFARKTSGSLAAV